MFLALASIWTIVVISPGPCFVAIVQQTTRGTRRHGMIAASVIATGTLVWCADSLLELNFLFTTFTRLYNLVNVAGVVNGALTGVTLERLLRRRLPQQ